MNRPMVELDYTLIYPLLLSLAGPGLSGRFIGLIHALGRFIGLIHALGRFIGLIHALAKFLR